MTGRSGGRSSNRGGRGRGRSSGRSGTQRSRGSTRNNTEKKYKFVPHTIGNSSQYYTYNEVKKHFLNAISIKLGEYSTDVYKALDTETEYKPTAPVRKKANFVAYPVKPEKKSTMDDVAYDKALEDFEKRQGNANALNMVAKYQQESYDMTYKSELSEHQKRVSAYDRNMPRAYDILMSQYCNTVMKHRVEEQKDYESTIKHKPIKALQVIKILSHDPVRARYSYASLLESMERLINIHQQDKESLLAYLERFKQVRDVASSYLSKDFLDKFVENTPDYVNENDTNLKTKMKSEAFDRFMTYTFVKRSNPKIYGSVVRRWAASYAEGVKDTYPKNLESAMDILSQHRPDTIEQQKLQKQVANKLSDDKDKTDQQSVDTSFAQTGKSKTFCYVCGSEGHLSPDCPKRQSTPQSDWYVNKMHSHMQGEQPHDADASTTSEDKSDEQSAKSDAQRRTWYQQPPPRSAKQFIQIGAMDIEVQMNQQPQEAAAALRHSLQNVIIIDCASTIDLFCNKELTEGDTWISDAPIMMLTNAGIKTHRVLAKVPGLNTPVWYDKDAMTNILSLNTLKKLFHVTYDSKADDSFTIQLPDGNVIKFSPGKSGLYAFTPAQFAFYTQMVDSSTHRNREVPRNDVDVTMIQTVEENKKYYTKRQLDDANKARELYHILGAPSTPAFKSMIRMNQIKDCPVTIDHINIADKIYGTDVSTLKGKSTRKSPPRLLPDVVDVPKELYMRNQELHLYIDGMYVNRRGFLTTIDNKIRFRSAVRIKDNTKSTFYSALDKVLRVYNAAGFLVTTIHADNQFKPLFEPIKDDLDIDMDYVPAQAHVPEAERNNRTIKERIRVAFYRLPYHRIPHIMMDCLVLESVYRLNLFPAKGGVSPYYSPQTIMFNTSLDYNKHCSIPFGSFVQVVQDDPSTKNTNRPRSLDGIYLRPLRGDQPGHEIMHLATGDVVTRPHSWCKIIPIGDSVLDAVHALADRDNVKGLKIVDWRGRIIPNVEHSDEPMSDTSPAGVDDTITTIDLSINEQSDDESYQSDITHDEDAPFQDYDDDTWSFETIQQEEIDELLADQYDDETHSVQSEESDQQLSQQEQDEAESQAQDEHSQSQPQASDTEQHVEPQTRRYPLRERHVERPMNISTSTGQSYAQRIEINYNLVHQAVDRQDYDIIDAQLMGMLMLQINTYDEVTFAQQYLLHEGLRRFGTKGRDAVKKEVKQLHDRLCFKPIDVSTLTKEEKRKAQVALIFLTEKRDGTIKAREVYNGKPTREWLSREDAASPTASLESLILLGVIDVKETRDVMCVDIPNAFIQARLPNADVGERIIMKITGVLVDILIDVAPNVYSGYVVYDRGKKVLYVEVLKAIYGMLIAALVWYRKFRTDLESIGFEFNPYDACVANRLVNDKQHTIRFHVDDLMSSHEDYRVNDQFYSWLNDMYGKIGDVKEHRGNVHDYLGIDFRYYKDMLILDMTKYVKSMVDEFPEKISTRGVARTPAGDDIFDEREGKPLPKDKAETYHTFVAKGLFLAKRARLDILPTIAVLCTRVALPTESEWKKLVRLMKYLDATRDKVLRIDTSGDLSVLKWMIDASYGVHPDMKSHTGAVLHMDNSKGGALMATSAKQKLNTRSSTEAELVAVDDVATMILWTQLFLEAQGYMVERNIVYQDNQSAILLETNGKKSSGKRTRALNIRYFFITDQVEKGIVQIMHCPTDHMIGDFMTKPLQGSKYQVFEREIMGLSFAFLMVDD